MSFCVGGNLSRTELILWHFLSLPRDGVVDVAAARVLNAFVIDRQSSHTLLVQSYCDTQALRITLILDSVGVTRFAGSVLIWVAFCYHLCQVFLIYFNNSLTVFMDGKLWWLRQLEASFAAFNPVNPQAVVCIYLMKITLSDV